MSIQSIVIYSNRCEFWNFLSELVFTMVNNLLALASHLLAFTVALLAFNIEILTYDYDYLRLY